MSSTALNESIGEDPIPLEQGSGPVLDMLLCISRGSTEEQVAAMENILFITPCYCYLLFSLKIPERFRRGRRKHQFGFTLHIPRAWNASGTPWTSPLFVSSPQLSQTAVHQQMSLSPDHRCPSFLLPQEMQTLSPTLVPAWLLTSRVWPKSPLNLLSQGCLEKLIASTSIALPGCHPRLVGWSWLTSLHGAGAQGILLGGVKFWLLLWSPESRCSSQLVC